MSLTLTCHVPAAPLGLLLGTFGKYYEAAHLVGGEVQRASEAGAGDRAVLCCGTGAGMAVVANRYPAVVAVPCASEQAARDARSINDCNVLALGGMTTAADEAAKCARGRSGVERSAVRGCAICGGGLACWEHTCAWEAPPQRRELGMPEPLPGRRKRSAELSHAAQHLASRGRKPCPPAPTSDPAAQDRRRLACDRIQGGLGAGHPGLPGAVQA